MKNTEPRKQRKVTHVCPDHDRIVGASVTYQLELVTCGKPKCRRWHGPYWYAYWSEGGRTRSIYIGKTLRPAADVAAELVQRTRAKAREQKKQSHEPKQQRPSRARRARPPTNSPRSGSTDGSVPSRR